MVGVTSTSKLTGIRSFNKKDHYNQWQFIYDPSSDRGGLVMTPNQPPLQNAVAPAATPQQAGAATSLGAPTSKPLSPGLQSQPSDQNNSQQ